MLGATQLAAAGGPYLPGFLFSQRLHAEGAMMPYPHGAAAAALCTAQPFCTSPACCIGHAMTPLHGDLLAKYFEYIKQRAGAAFHYAATHPASFLTNFAPEKHINEKSPADFVVLQKDTAQGCRIGVFCASAFLRHGDIYGPMPQPRPEKAELGAEAPLPPQSVSCESGDNAWMLRVRTATSVVEANMVALQRGGCVYYRTTKAVWRGEEIVVLVDDFPVEATDETTDERAEAKRDEGFQCDRCGKMFAYKYYRDKHLKYTRCVDKGDRKFPCSLCDRSFEKRDRLRIHILHVHEKHRPHQCTACGKRFSQSSSLNKHTRVHSGERPYKCMYCTKAFTASSILRTHIRQHSGEKPFKCKHCGKAFASHAAHDSHVRRTHKDATAAPMASDKEEVLSQCPNSSPLKGVLEMTFSTQSKEDDIDVVQ